MREIKFRAWVINDQFPKGKMWYSDDIENPYLMNLSGDLIYDKHVKNFDHILTWARISCNWDLMQYTGLKDKNGKEIYEGDIVRVNETFIAPNEISKNRIGADIVNWDFQGVVTWDERGADFDIRDSKTDLQRGIDADGMQFEVIGNIHENPELLK